MNEIGRVTGGESGGVDRTRKARRRFLRSNGRWARKGDAECRRPGPKTAQRSGKRSGYVFVFHELHNKSVDGESLF